MRTTGTLYPGAGGALFSEAVSGLPLGSLANLHTGRLLPQHPLRDTRAFCT